MTTVLVTGGAGFIGSHCVDRLLAGGHRVVVFDDFRAGRRCHLERHDGDARLAVVDGDVRCVSDLRAAIAGAGATRVLHLAALHFIPYCVEHPDETLDVNVEGTRAVLDAVAGGCVDRLVLASTAAVYAPAEDPHAESAPLGPLDVYGESKLRAERLVLAAGARTSPLRVAVARLFNVYGPRETNPHVVPDLIAQLRHDGVARPGSVWPRRDYVWVEDAADALTRLLGWDGPPLVVNVGTGRATSVMDLLAVFEKVLGRAIAVAPDAAKVRRTERACLVADTVRAARVLGWSASTELADGLARLLGAALPGAPGAA